MNEIFQNRRPVRLDPDWFNALFVRLHRFPRGDLQYPEKEKNEVVGTVGQLFDLMKFEVIQSVSMREVETGLEQYVFPFFSGMAGDRFLWLACKLWMERQVSIGDCRFFPIRQTHVDTDCESDLYFISYEDTILVEDFSLVYERDRSPTFPKFRASPNLLASETKTEAAFTEMMYRKFYRETYFGLLLSFKEFGLPDEEKAALQTLERLRLPLKRSRQN